MIKIKIQ